MLGDAYGAAIVHKLCLADFEKADRQAALERAEKLAAGTSGGDKSLSGLPPLVPAPGVGFTPNTRPSVSPPTGLMEAVEAGQKFPLRRIRSTDVDTLSSARTSTYSQDSGSFKQPQEQEQSADGGEQK